MPLRSAIALLCIPGILLVGIPRPSGAIEPIRLARKAAPTKLVDQGIQFYYEGRYERAVRVLDQALKSSKLNESRRLGALQYKAFCQVALGESKKAKLTFRQILEIRPDFRLPAGTAPKIMTLFESVKSKLVPPKPTEPPKLSHTPPEAGEAGSSLEVEARVDYLPPAGELLVHYRYTQGSEYSRLRMSARPDGRYTATIPAPLSTGNSNVMYHLEVVDGTGVRMAGIGSDDDPITIAFASTEPREVKDDDEGTSTWWIWPVVGAVLLGAGLAIGLTLADKDSPQGSAVITFDLFD